MRRLNHWRQDWTFEPREVLVYAGRSRWRLRPVERAERTGAWSQTVWQTDDSPRYGGVGRWDYSVGGAIWTSETALRPLARRDAIRHPPHDRHLAINRHALTPAGWAHEQDSAKLGLRDGRLVLFAHEDGVSSYARFADAIASGEAQTAQALADARATIEDATTAWDRWRSTGFQPAFLSTGISAPAASAGAASSPPERNADHRAVLLEVAKIVRAF